MTRLCQQGAVMELTTQDHMLVEQRVSNSRKSTGLAYVLWFFFFWISAHRFYLGRPGTALLQIASYFVLIGFLWALLDAFLMPGMVEGQTRKTRKLWADAARAHKASVQT